MEPEEIINGTATEEAAAEHPNEAAPAPSMLAELVAERDRAIKEKNELLDLMQRRQASINDVEIEATDRKFTWEGDRRPDDFPGLTELGL